MTSPSVSVIMAVHNGERYLREAVESVLGQTLRDFEFVIVDDGSTDGTPDLLRRFAERDSRIRLIFNERNQGLSRSLNLGLDRAKAPLVARMDADDVSLPDRLAKQVQFITTTPDCILLGSRVLSIDPDGAPICRERQPLTHEEIEEQLFRGWGGAIPHPTAMFRTVPARRRGGYNEELRVTQDLDLWLKLAEQGCLANLPDVLLHYRRHAHSLSARPEAFRDEAASVLTAAYGRREVERPADFMSRFMLDREGLAARLEWCRLATYDGFYDTARKHALRALRERPWCAGAWRALVRVALYRSGLRSTGKNVPERAMAKE